MIEKRRSFLSGVSRAQELGSATCVKNLSKGLKEFKWKGTERLFRKRSREFRFRKSRAFQFFHTLTQVFTQVAKPSSGTEYIRDLLNTSKDINCQKSTIGSPALLWMAFNELRREKEMKRLHLAGISEELMFKATGEGILEIVFGTRQGKIPCLEEPMILNQMEFLAENFPNAKFLRTMIYMNLY